MGWCGDRSNIKSYGAWLGVWALGDKRQGRWHGGFLIVIDDDIKDTIFSTKPNMYWTIIIVKPNTPLNNMKKKAAYILPISLHPCHTLN